MIVILSLYVHCLLLNSTTFFRSFLIQLFFSDIEETLQLKIRRKILLVTYRQNFLLKFFLKRYIYLLFAKMRSKSKYTNFRIVIVK